MVTLLAYNMQQHIAVNSSNRYRYHNPHILRITRHDQRQHTFASANADHFTETSTKSDSGFEPGFRIDLNEDAGVRRTAPKMNSFPCWRQSFRLVS